jgi:hypothetical protein
MKADDTTAYDLFECGFDTLEIAVCLKITEAEALKQVSSQRSAKLGLPSPYEFKTASWPSGRVAYAGA